MTMRTRPILFAALLSLSWGAVMPAESVAPRAERNQERPAAKVPLVRCTPDSVSVGQGNPRPSRNPIAEALQMCAPGGLIELFPGDYPAFSLGFSKASHWNAATSGGTRSSPILVRGIGEVRIVPGSGGDTISINQQMRCGFVTFEGLTIQCGYRAAVMFYKVAEPALHEGFRFIDCNIEGDWNHIAASGNNSKWGVWGQRLKDFEFKGVRRRAVVRNIRHEHAFYLQNSCGDITIENVDASRLGRTFVQFTARPGDGPVGTGTILVKNCTVEDACISRGDDFKGGSAFTLAGRHLGTTIFEGNRYRAGFSSGIQTLTRDGVPYGTGAVVSWDGRGERNGTLILKDNVFEFAPGCGDRAVVSLGGCREVQIVGKNRFISGGKTPALDLDPPPTSGIATNPNLAIRVAETTEYQGSVRIAGETASKKQLAELAPKAKEEPPSEPEQDGRR